MAKATDTEIDMIAELAVDILNDSQFKRSGLDRQDFIDLVRNGYTKVFKYVSPSIIEKYRYDYPHVDIIELEEGKHFIKLKGYKLTDKEKDELYKYEFNGKKEIMKKELDTFSNTREYTFIDDDGKKRGVTTAYIKGMNFKTKDELYKFIDSLDITRNEKKILNKHVDNLSNSEKAIKDYALNFIKAYEANKIRDFSTKASVENDY